VKSSLGLLALSHALLWILVNTAWLDVGSEQLTGSQLSNTLNLLPAIALIMVFISAYKKLQRTLWIGSGLTSALVGVIALTTNFAQSPAVVEILENLSGVQNATPADAGLILTAGPMIWVSAITSVIALGLSLLLAIRPPQPRSKEVAAAIEDNRSLWDSQS
jgi:hypothetical protein